MYVLLGIGLIAAIAVLVSASGNTGFYYSYWFQEYGPMVGILVFAIMMVLIAIGIKPDKEAYDLNKVFRKSN